MTRIVFSTKTGILSKINIMSVNKILLLGNLGSEPDVREVNGGKIAKFRLATTDRAYTNKQGIQVPEQTQWHSCIAFGKQADIISQFIHKGTKLFVEGKMKYGKYTDNQGVERWTADVIIDNFEILTPKSDNQGQQQGGYQQPQYTPQPNGYGRDPLQDFAAPPPTAKAKEIPGYNPPGNLWDDPLP